MHTHRDVCVCVCLEDNSNAKYKQKMIIYSICFKVHEQDAVIQERSLLPKNDQ